MAKKRSEDIERQILSLLKTKSEIRVPDVALSAGMSNSSEADRKAIRRVLSSLVERGVLRVEGAARARVYVLVASSNEAVNSAKFERDAFKDIPLSNESIRLRDYLSQNLKRRTPVGYDQDFLRRYEPNQTFYLSADERNELLRIGRTEDKVRPAGTYARNILNRLLIDLSWNSSRLEGNTYSLLETKRLLELGESAAGKDLTEAQMILNHKGAIEYIIESASEETITSHHVCSVHALLSENLLGDPGASGRIRQISVGISGSTYIPLENQYVINECFQLFIDKLNQIKDPFEQSIFSLVHLSYLQAFEDVNKRTARLMSNIPFMRMNLKPLSFTDVDQDAYVKALLGVYEKNEVSLLRDLYLWAYERSALRYTAIQQSMGEPNHLKLKYRAEIQEIIRGLILDKISGREVVGRIRKSLELEQFPEADKLELFKIIETEVMSLHEGNIARFRIRPSEFQDWKDLETKGQTS